MGSVVDEKLKCLREILFRVDSVLIAFSGGTDSSLLLAIASRIIRGKCLAVMIASEFVPSWEIRNARKIAKKLNVKLRIVKVRVLLNAKIKNNDRLRCYCCKQLIIKELQKIAEQEDIAVIMDGSNADDFKMHRPGKKALTEAGVHSPLAECGLTKEQVRIIARNYKLPNWNKPSSSCLATRFAYGEELNSISLNRVMEAEQFLRGYVKGQLRVRSHGNLARIEVSLPEMKKLLNIPGRNLLKKFKKLGFVQVCVDLGGFRSGSMDF